MWGVTFVIGIVASVIGIVASLLAVASGELLVPFGAKMKLAGSLSLAVSLPTTLAGFTH